jgi:hypothetical protein
MPNANLSDESKVGQTRHGSHFRHQLGLCRLAAVHLLLLLPLSLQEQMLDPQEEHEAECGTPLTGGVTPAAWCVSGI